MLVAIFGEKDSHAVYYLHQQGVTRLDVVNFISHGITKAGRAKKKPNLAPKRRPKVTARISRPHSSSTPQNLNALAKDGKIDR